MWLGIWSQLLMGNLIVFCSPLSVPISKNKKFILNLNNYRNAHHQKLNKSKKAYKEAVLPQLLGCPPFNKVKIHYTLYPKTRRRTDIGNVIAIHKKYFEDVLVECGKLPDDDYTHVIGSSESFGHVDKDNGRVEIAIERI